MNDYPSAKMPNFRIFEKQFIILLAVISMIGLNTYWTYQVLNRIENQNTNLINNQMVQYEKLTLKQQNTTDTIKNESTIDRGRSGNITSDIITDLGTKIDNSTMERK